MLASRGGPISPLNILFIVSFYIWKWRSAAVTKLIDGLRRIGSIITIVSLHQCYIGASIGNRNNLAYRMICGCISLVAVVLSITYPAIYTAQLTVPHYQVLVKSIEDVAANPDIKVYGSRGSATTNYLLVNFMLSSREKRYFQSLFLGFKKWDFKDHWRSISN